MFKGKRLDEISSNYPPMVTEETPKGERRYDLYSRLLKERVIVLGTPVTDDVATNIIAQLFFLEMTGSKKDIHFYINSPGGSVTSGLAIYDIMQFISCDIYTYCMGLSASMGSLLLTAGTSGKRYILPNSKVMIHQPLISGGLSGPASDIEIHAQEMVRTKEQLTEIYVKHTGRTFEELTKALDRDNFMSASEAKEFGLVDEIVESRKKSAKE